MSLANVILGRGPAQNVTAALQRPEPSSLETSTGDWERAIPALAFVPSPHFAHARAQSSVDRSEDK